MSKYSHEVMAPFVTRKNNVADQTNLALSDGDNREKYEPKETFNSRLYELILEASDIALKWKMLRLALIYKYRISYFRLPENNPPIDLSHFG